VQPGAGAAAQKGARRRSSASQPLPPFGRDTLAKLGAAQ